MASCTEGVNTFLENYSCLGKSQKPVSVTVKMRNVPEACELSPLKHAGSMSRHLGALGEQGKSSPQGKGSV